MSAGAGGTSVPESAQAPARAAAPENGSRLARTGASLGAGSLALSLLAVGGYLSLIRRRPA